MKRIRQAARILVTDSQDRILLFRFSYDSGPLAGMNYWSVPGGGVEPGESVAEAAVRELLEETGIVAEAFGEPVTENTYDFRLSTGEEVAAHDHYFVFRPQTVPPLSRAGLTELERHTLVETRWWSIDDLLATQEHVVPANLPDLLKQAWENR